MPSRPVISAVFVAVALVLALTAAYRARALRDRPRPPDVVALVLLLSALATSFLVQAPAAREVLNQVRVNLGQLLGNGFTLVAACSATAMVLFILYEPAAARRRLRVRVAALAVAVVAMTVLFLADPAAPEAFTDPASSLTVITYYLVYLVYLSAALVDLSLLVRRRARGETDAWVRTGMRMVAASCVVALFYTAGRMINLTLDYAGIEVDAPGETTFGLLEFLVAAVLPAVAALLAVAGFTLRRWGPPALRPFSALARMRRHRAAHATEDVDLDGVTVPAEHPVVVSPLAANRDPRQFPDPDVLDVRRDTSGAVPFGHGVHHCLGAPLGRMEARAVLEAVLTSVPDLELDDGEPLRYRHSMLVRGLEALPVRRTGVG